MHLLSRLIIFLSVILFCSCTANVMPDWHIEDQSGAMLVRNSGDTLDIEVPQGLTLWYNKRLTGAYEISYQICMVMQGGKYDRLSDLNCFWGANDPKHLQDLFARSEWRNGIFRHYNTLNLFYVGYGGNDNTTTRFRRYHAEYYSVDDAKLKPIIKEYSDEEHLLKPNKWYHIQIQVTNETTTYSVNGEELFSYPLEPGGGDGYFGLRLLENHVLFTGFKVDSIIQVR